MKLIDNMVADIRYEKGLTQQELADMLGVTKRAVGNWESRINGISPKMQIKLIEALETEREALFTYDNSK